jgi:hypothetical protein
MALFAGAGTIAINSSPAADKWSGPHTHALAHSAFTLGLVGYINASGEVALGDANAEATAGVMLLALGTITAHTVGQFLKPGSVVHIHTLAPGWTPGGKVYLAAAAGGLMTQTPPSGAGDMIQVLGTALAADILDFDPCLMMVEHG